MDKEIKNESVTIYDIAREAEVSPATVSRILTGSAGVASEKRERVQRLIKKYNYVPNAFAQGLNKKESKTIGLLMPDVRNPFYSSLYVGIETAAVKYGYNVILCNALNDDNIERQHMDTLISKSVDVIILSGGLSDNLQCSGEQLEQLKRAAEKTLIIVAGQMDYFECSTINIDDRPGMEALLGYLIGLGHREICLVGGTSTKLPTYSKQKIFKEILERNNLPMKENTIIETPRYGIDDGYYTGKKLFAEKNFPTAVIGINESVALGIMRAAFKMGLEIPRDISIAGFDNTYLSEISTPSLTSAGCCYEDYGEILMNQIVRMKTSETKIKKVTIPNSLTIRKSCGESARNAG